VSAYAIITEAMRELRSSRINGRTAELRSLLHFASFQKIAHHRSALERQCAAKVESTFLSAALVKTQAPLMRFHHQRSRTYSTLDCFAPVVTSQLESCHRPFLRDTCTLCQ